MVQCGQLPMASDYKKKHWKKIVKELSDMHAEALDFKQTLNQDALANYRRFEVLEDMEAQAQQGHRYKGRSRVVDPEPNRVIESIVPRIAKGAVVRFVGRNGVGINNTFALNKVAEYVLDVMKFELKSKMWVKEGLITKISFGRLLWRLENAVGRRKRVSLDETVEDGEPVYDLPWFEPLDFFKVSWDPRATDYDSCKYFFVDFEETKPGLAQNNNYDSDKVKKLQPAAAVNRTRDFSRQRLSEKGMSQKDGAEGLIHGFEFYGKYDIDDDGRYEMCHIVVAGTDTENGSAGILKCEVNEFDHGQNPIIPFRPLPNPHQMAGMSVLDAPAGLFAALTALMRQTLDAGTLSLNPIVKALKGAGVDFKKLISKPGAVWTMNDLQAIDVVKLPDPSAWSNNMMQDLRANIQNTTGATDFISGGTTVSSRTTATEFVGKVEQANAKFQSMLEMFEKESLQIFGDQLKSLLQQFFDEERTILITGPKGEKIPARVGVEDILGDFTTITETNASKVGDQRIRAQSTLQAWQMFANDPYTDQVWLRQKVMENVFEWRDAEEHIQDPNAAKQQALAKESERMNSENQNPFLARISPGDDDVSHIKIHDLVLTNMKLMEELESQVGVGAVEALLEHREEHVQQYWLKAGVEKPPNRTVTEDGSGGELGEIMGKESGHEQGNELPPGTPGRPPMKATAEPSVEQALPQS